MSKYEHGQKWFSKHRKGSRNKSNLYDAVYGGSRERQRERAVDGYRPGMKNASAPRRTAPPVQSRRREP